MQQGHVHDMATRIGTQPQLCTFCRQRPIYGAYPYCGKTCAMQAANPVANGTLCHFCQRKPKFGKHNFCGRRCASSAIRKGPMLGNVGQSSAVSKPQRGAANPISRPKQARGPQAMMNVLQPSGQTAHSNPLSTSYVMVPPANQIPLQGPSGRNTYQGKVQGKPGFDDDDDDDDGLDDYPSEEYCRIPRCEQPVHVDMDGEPSDYCSLRHREEAVKAGLELPCIMCLALPQSQCDYFCGRSCREEAMNK